MCNKGDGCLQPEKSKGDPRLCSPEQIRRCHGDAACHPCACPMQQDSEGPDKKTFGTPSQEGATE
jgi:hypothetical protein